MKPFDRRLPEAGVASGEGSEVLGCCKVCGHLCGSGLTLPPRLHPVLGAGAKSANSDQNNKTYWKVTGD